MTDKKQINNHVFEYLQNGTVRVTYPDKSKKVMLLNEANNLYKMLYADKNADKIVLEVLKELGYTVENIHLTDEYVVNTFKNKLRARLQREQIDLSWLSIVTSKLNAKIGGNSDAIVYDYIKFLWSNPWKELKMTPDEMRKHLKNNPKANLYIEKEPYSGVLMAFIPDKYIDELKPGTKFNRQGIGSQQSVIQHTVKVKIDKYKNLLLQEYSIVLD